MTYLQLAPVHGEPRRYGITHVVRAELVKLFTLRSTFWTLLVTFVGSLGATVLATSSAGHHNRGWYQGFDPTNQALSGLLLGVLAIGVLGVLAATGEYGTGTIRASLAAGPRRRLLLAGKVLVIAAVALAVSEALTFSCFWTGQAVLAHGGAPTASLSQPGVLRAVALSGAFLALLGLGGLGLGVIIRHTAGALSTYVGLTFLLPFLLQRIPSQPGRFTPVLLLANSVSAVAPQGPHVNAGVGFGLMALYSAAVLVFAGALLLRRDA
ncbi:MAG TPA: ABC transporter permease subunit [Acidimicrobiales bacterium]|nr:ABC transporter permease subunit [Acidimicrobiales bacterium]